MAIPHIVRIGHAVLTVKDLAASRYFYVELLGLNVLHETADALYLRGTEDREWTLKLERDMGTPRLRHIAYKVWSDEALDELEALAEREGLPHRWETEHDRPRLLRMQDPFGFPVAFYCTAVRHRWLLQDFHLHRGAGIQRVDHNNVLTPRVGAMMAWYRERLGFRLTEFSEDDDHRIWAAWMQRRGTVHDLALTNGAGPRLHHFAFWMPDPNRVLQLCDILSAGGQPGAIERGPGRHGISNAFFLYVRDPDGHRIELYTCDYSSVDPDFEPIRWHVNDPKRQQMWGGLAPKSWFTEGTPVEAFGGGVEKMQEAELKGLPAYIE